jgi:hypothetical protein
MPNALPRWLNAAAFAALAGCSSHTSSTTPPIDDPGGTTETTPPGDTGTGSGSDTGPGPQACAPAGTTGSTIFAIDTGTGAFDLQSSVAVDAAGDVFYTRGRAGAFSLTRYTPAGKLVYTVPYGEVVAADATGNAYVAATFTTTIDIGLGPMVPADDMDVFVAKLGPDGTPVFARALGLCPDSVRAIAVSGDGRIAVSGDEMGTLVLDAKGELLFRRDFAGDLAFDSAGNLIVAGGFSGAIALGDGVSFATAGDLDGFVVKLDRDGNHLWSQRFGDATLPIQLLGDGGTVSDPTRQLIDAVAIGPGDEVVLVGQFDKDAKLFGKDYAAAHVAIASVPLQSGGFVIALDASGAMDQTTVQLGIGDYTDVAVDSRGNQVVTGSELVDFGAPFRAALLARHTAAGGTDFARANAIGAGHAVAVDACGAMLWSASVRRGNPDQPLVSTLVKLAP